MWCSGPGVVHSGSAEQGQGWTGYGQMTMSTGEERGSVHAAWCLQAGTEDAAGLESFESEVAFGTGKRVAQTAVELCMWLGDSAVRSVSYEFEATHEGQIVSGVELEPLSAVGSDFVLASLSGKECDLVLVSSTAKESELVLESLPGVESEVGLGSWLEVDTELVLVSLSGVDCGLVLASLSGFDSGLLSF